MSPAWRLFSGTAAVAATKTLQSCLILCDPIDSSPAGSSLPGTLQARGLEWVAISFFNACMHANSLQLSPTLCDPMGSSPPDFSVHWIPQARILKWVAIAFSRNRDPEPGVRRSCSWQVRRERFLCFLGREEPGAEGGLTLGSLVLGSSSGRLSLCVSVA